MNELQRLGRFQMVQGAVDLFYCPKCSTMTTGYNKKCQVCWLRQDYEELRQSIVEEENKVRVMN